MTLQPGTRLGPYEVVSPIGAGGMGEVYRAKDTRLDRTVAVKVLPALLAADPEFRERFDREARSISALAHPNICTLHDVGEHRLSADGSVARFLVMEYLEGETLAARLEKGPLPLNDALRIAIEIASALEKAHRHGVIHRDLKPANVMLTKSGAKLLDFGLAKSNHGGPFAAATTLATMTSPPAGTKNAPLTTRGSILGTIQYMAPEQVEGEEAGPRADLFAFGAVLYEMITGRRAFTGKSQASLLGAILKEDPPPLSQLQPMAPPALEGLVKACLAKDPDDRLQSAHDVLLQLRWIQEDGSAGGLAGPVTAQRRQRERAAWIAVAVVGALWLATLVPAVRSFRTPPEPAKVQFALNIGDVGITNSLYLALSPDGRTLAYIAQAAGGGGPSVLWVRELDNLQPRSLPGTEGAVSPFWSPDSRMLGFAAAGKLQTVSLAGGLPQPLCDIPVTFFGATWNGDGTILFALGNSANNVTLARIDARGGDVVQVAQPDRSRQQVGLFWPQFLPDGRHYLYLATTTDPAKRAIYAGSLEGGAPVLLVHSIAAAVFVRPGFLLYVRDGSLVAHPFDTERMTLTGNPIRLADTVIYSRITGRVAFTASDNGILAFRSGVPVDALSQLVWLNRAGHVIKTVGDAAPYNQFRLSPDEKRVAVVLADNRSFGYNISTMELSSGIMTQLLFQETTNDPVWSPDSQSVAFESVLKGKRDFYRQTVGSRDATLMYESPEDPKWLNDWSRDGQFLLFHLPRPGKLFALPLSGDGKRMLLAETTGTFDGAHFSHDGRWVAYQQSDPGEFEVWVAAFPAFDHRRRVSARGGGQAFWRADGKELFYLTSDGKLMSVAVASDPARPGALEFRAPVELFQSPLSRPVLTIDQYSAAADGQRFLFLQPRRDPASTTSPVTVVLNWFTGLK